jgi:hypothetical protein
MMTRTLTAIGSILLALQAGPAAASDIVGSIDVAGGWTNSGYHYGNHTVSLSGPAMDVTIAAGWRLGRVDVGGVAGLLAAPSLDSAWIEATHPESFLAPHAGGFASLRLWQAPITLTARLEFAYGRISGQTFISDAPPSSGHLKSSVGGLASALALYDLPTGAARRFTIGLDVSGGWLVGNMAQFTPLVVLGIVGAHWD